jgi:hypothetical protein
MGDTINDLGADFGVLETKLETTVFERNDECVIGGGGKIYIVERGFTVDLVPRDIMTARGFNTESGNRTHDEFGAQTLDDAIANDIGGEDKG